MKEEGKGIREHTIGDPLSGARFVPGKRHLDPLASGAPPPLPQSARSCQLISQAVPTSSPHQRSAPPSLSS